MDQTKTHQAVSSAKAITVISRDTGKVYRAIRAYHHSLLVTPAWR